MPAPQTTLRNAPPVSRCGLGLVLLVLQLSGCIHDLRGECVAPGQARDIDSRMSACYAALRYDERDAEVISTIAIRYFLDNRTKEAWDLVDKLSVKKDDKERKLTASVLGLIGVRLYNAERYIDAANLQEQAIELFKQGPQNRKPDAAIVSNLYNLALSSYAMGHNKKSHQLISESMYRFDALEKTEYTFKKLFFGDFVLRSEWSLSRQGQYVKLKMLNLRAGLSEAEGKLPEALSDYSEAMRISEIIMSDNFVSWSPSFNRAVRSQPNLMSLSVADMANNLARLQLALGDFAKARELAARSLTIREYRYSADHPEIMRSLQVLALIDIAQGKIAEAQTKLERSSEIVANNLGSNSIELAALIHTQATSLLIANRYDAAVSAWSRSLSIEHQRVRLVLSQSEIFGISDVFQPQAQLLYGLPLLLPDQPQFRELALRAALLHKGRTFDAAVQVGRLLKQASEDQELASQRQRLNELRDEQRRELSRAEQNPRKLRDLSEQLDQASDQLARRLLQKGHAPAPQDIVAATASRLSPRSVLMDVELAIRPKQLTVDGLDPEQPKHYVALLLFPDRRVEVADLGDAAVVDAAVADFLRTMQTPSSDPERAARALYDRVLRPVRGFLGSAQQVYLSLDGQLAMVPFAALHDGSRYMLHAYRFNYLTSGRDVLRPQAPRSQKEALVLADPDPRAGWTGGADASRSSSHASRLLAAKLAALPPLPGAAEEGQTIAEQLRVTAFVGASAREELLNAAKAPWLLHIATHGLWLDEDVGTALSGPRPRSLLLRLPTNKAESPHVIHSFADSLHEMERSALVLGGAAQGVLWGQAERNGLFSALEASQLDLHGTQLVVLSACETGRGAASIGQGSFGLRRGFLSAGAESLLASQWQIDDQATAELMSKFYANAFDDGQPLSRLSALQRAMLEVYQHHPHPYYWAPFILLGEDGFLSRPASHPQG